MAIKESQGTVSSNGGREHFSTSLRVLASFSSVQGVRSGSATFGVFLILLANMVAQLLSCSI